MGVSAVVSRSRDVTFGLRYVFESKTKYSKKKASRKVLHQCKTSYQTALRHIDIYSNMSS